MESANYCPMGSPVHDATTHLGVTCSSDSPRRGPVNSILLLLSAYHTPKGPSGLDVVRWTAGWGTQWGHMDGEPMRCELVSGADAPLADDGAVSFGEQC